LLLIPFEGNSFLILVATKITKVTNELAESN
jgi:hypothetical protein